MSNVSRNEGIHDDPHMMTTDVEVLIEDAPIAPIDSTDIPFSFPVYDPLSPPYDPSYSVHSPPFWDVPASQDHVTALPNPTPALSVPTPSNPPALGVLHDTIAKYRPSRCSGGIIKHTARKRVPCPGARLSFTTIWENEPDTEEDPEEDMDEVTVEDVKDDFDDDPQEESEEEDPSEDDPQEVYDDEDPIEEEPQEESEDEDPSEDDPTEEQAPNQEPPANEEMPQDNNGMDSVGEEVPVEEEIPMQQDPVYPQAPAPAPAPALPQGVTGLIPAINQNNLDRIAFLERSLRSAHEQLLDDRSEANRYRYAYHTVTRWYRGVSEDTIQNLTDDIHVGMQPTTLTHVQMLLGIQERLSIVEGFDEELRAWAEKYPTPTGP